MSDFGDECAKCGAYAGASNLCRNCERASLKKPPKKLKPDTEAVMALIAAAEDAQCTCTLEERMSGHVSECWMPILVQAVYKAKAQFRC